MVQKGKKQGDHQNWDLITELIAQRSAMNSGQGCHESDFLECLPPHVLRMLPVLTNLLFTTTRRGSHYYDFHFTDEATEAWKV